MSTTPEHTAKKVREAKKKRLKELDLSWESGFEKLTYIPDEVFELYQLEGLSLSHNLLKSIPDRILCLRNLKKLDLSSNRFVEIPDIIGQLYNLSWLSLRYNNLSSIPYWITDLQDLKLLDLSWNEFKSLPHFITSLQSLETLDISNNPIVTPPLEVAVKGIIAIREYYRQIEEEGKDYLYEAKLLIVGEGGAGKTTLANKIVTPDYQLKDDEVSTEGIEISMWEFPMENGKKFRLNIWDFGGQEIYHATHQFFLTKRSFYVLVADTRKEDTDFHYWLNVVELLSDNSPLLIVKNEKQDRHREINERQLRGQFTSLKETLACNLSTNRGLDRVLSEIRHYSSNLSHIGNELPKTWVKVRAVLENDPRNYISLEEYLTICGQHGFKERKDKLQLSGYLHDLGVCLHFQDDALLKKTLILKPEWGTDAVYKALDNKKVIRNFGKFTRLDLSEIWHEDKYVNMHDELLQLMVKFKLCYKIKDSDFYIAPQLLTRNQPDYVWDPTNNLILRYTYEFMPKGIIIQFIVAMHKWIAQNQKCVWREGVVLQKDGTLAEVIEYYSKREIKIRISGKHKKELLTVVLYEMDRIHDSYSGRLKCNKMLPCNCSQCKHNQEPNAYEYDQLRQLVDKKIYEIPCYKSGMMVNILSLVEDVMDRKQFLEAKDKRLGNVNIHGNIDQIVIQQQSGEGHNIMGEKENNSQLKSSWANGSFYLFAFSLVIGGLGFLAGSIPLHSLAVIIVAGILIVPIIGAFQLRQDKRLSEKTFLELMRLVLGQLPLIGKLTGEKKQLKE